MQIICIGQQNWDVCWTGKQQLMTRLAQRGHRVLYVDPQWDAQPLPLRDRVRALWPAWSGHGLAASGIPGLHIFRGQYVHGLGRLNSYRWKFVLRGVMRRLEMHDPIAIALRPDLASWLDVARPRAKVYFAVDDMSAFPHIRDPARERAAEEALIRRVDLAIGVSEPLYARMRALTPHAAHLENAADVDHFSPARLARTPPHPIVRALPRPRLGFVGQVDERLDQGLLLHLVERHPDWHIVLAGRVKTGVDVAALDAHPRIHVLGYQHYADLPGVLREVDVCLIPYHLNALTQACSPLKAFEYLATGLPVVATPLDGLGSARAGVATARSADEFAQAVAAALAHPSRGRAERLAIAAANSWDARVDVLEQLLADTLERARARDGRARALPAAPRRARLSRVQRAAYALANGIGRARRSLRRATPASTNGRPRATHDAGGTTAAPRRILVVRSRSHLGDLLAIVPMLAALRRAYPDARLELGIERDVPWLALLPPGLVDGVRPLRGLERPTRADRLRGLWPTIAAGYDLVISGSRWFVAPDAMYSGARMRLGLDDGDATQRLNTHRLPYDPGRHEVDNNLALLDVLGIRVPPDARAPRVHVADEELATARRRLTSLGLPPGAEVIVLHAGAFKRTREWPAERFAELARRLLTRRPDAHVVLTGVESEAALAARIREALPPALRARAIVAAGRTDLTMLVALLDAARLVIANDTGVMHLARARARPLLALMGAEDHRRWGPYPQGPGPATVLRHIVPCAPCHRTECGALYCLRLLAVDTVEEEALRLLGMSPGARDYRLRVARHSWEALHADGFELPEAHVVVPADLAPGAAEAALGAQDFPRIVAVRAGADPEPAAAHGPERRVGLRFERDAPWRWSRYVGDRVARALREDAP